MTTALVIVVLVVLGLAVVACVRRVQGLLKEKEQLGEKNAAETEALRAEWQARLNEQKSDYERRLSEQKEEAEKRLGEQKEELLNDRQSISLVFKDLAAKVLDEQGKKLREMDDRSVASIVKPLKEDIDRLHREIGLSGEKAAAQSASFAQQMKHLLETTQAVSSQAETLAHALRGNIKRQGNWGEMILASVLEQSGLQEGTEYVLQESLTDEEGNRLIPDVIVSFPDKRRVVVDSKVSLNAFMDYSNAATADEAQQAARAHVESVRKHVKELAEKDYTGVVDNTLDFVLMFVQSDAAYMLAMQQEPTLAQEAYKKGVILTSPTTLMLTLRIVYNIWQADKQSKNVANIVMEVTNLYDKFAGCMESYEKIGRSIGTLQKQYDETKGQLSTGRGSVTSRFEKIRGMGLNPKKQLPAADE